MRRIGPLILVVILILGGMVTAAWMSRVKHQHKAAPAVPRMLPPNTSSTAEEWVYRQSNANGTSVEVHTKDYRQIANSDSMELTGMELHLFSKDGTTYDKVNSEKALFDTHAGLLYSEGAVSIAMKVPVNQSPDQGTLLIQSSGVHFESKTGKAYTDRPASFHFGRNEGSCVGASYDPQTHDLVLQSQVELIWRGRTEGTVPMRIEAGNAVYKELESKVYLSPWSKLTRDTLTMQGGAAVVTLADQRLQLVDAQSAKGADNQPGRRVEFSADHLVTNFDDDGLISHVTGDQNAHLTSSTKSGVIRVDADRVEMVMGGVNGNSILQAATAVGHAVSESTPAASPGAQAPERRLLRSDTLTAHMRPDGQEIDYVDSASPSTIEFIPVRAGQTHRVMTTQWMAIHYAAENRIQNMNASSVTTRTDKPAAPGAKTPPPPALTWSRNLTAEFDPTTGQMTHMKQWQDFRYEEGDRKARADAADLDQKENVITLTKSARVWDSTGTTSASSVVLDQTAGEFTASGEVNSTRMPDKSSDNSMLSSDEPLHARAAKMSTSDDNTKIRYEGHAVLWQGANRLEADVVDIDRDEGAMRAHGHVVSQLLDKKNDDAGQPGARHDQAPVYTVVHAPDMVYTDDDRQARYSGGATLERPDLNVKAKEIRAFLKPKQDDSAAPANQPKPTTVANSAPAGDKQVDGKSAAGDSSLDHAIAEKDVRIVSTQPGRTRTGTSEHAEYFTADGRVVLTGGKPQVVDSLKGTTKGRELTWFSQDDRLLVNGVETQPAGTIVLRKNKKK